MLRSIFFIVFGNVECDGEKSNDDTESDFLENEEECTNQAQAMKNCIVCENVVKHEGATG